MKTAYRIAAAHAAESPVKAADAEFHAGWYAFRGLNDAKTGAKHFARIAEIADGPISLARAYYWLGRAAEAGAPGDAKAYYRKAAVHGTTFYGQLAAERIGGKTLNVAYPEPSGGRPGGLRAPRNGQGDPAPGAAAATSGSRTCSTANLPRTHPAAANSRCSPPWPKSAATTCWR